MYGLHDPRGRPFLLFEEVNEDLNGNGILDPSEDTMSTVCSMCRTIYHSIAQTQMIRRERML